MIRATVAAPAKLNLVLAVGTRRDDGYHDITSLMQMVGLYDELTIECHDARGSGSSIQVNAPDVAGGDTLVTQAAQAMLVHSGRPVDVRVDLKKRIPVGAGLGGGSSDAAAVMRALNVVLDLGMEPAELMEIGATIGSDVPFFFAPSGTAVVRGRGEHVRPREAGPVQQWLLCWPGFLCETRQVFDEHARHGQSTPVAAMPRDDELTAVTAPLRNDLSNAFLALYPPARQHLETLTAAGATDWVLAGSGSTYAIRVDPTTDQPRIAAAARGMGMPLVETVSTCELPQVLTAE